MTFFLLVFGAAVSIACAVEWRAF